MKDKVENETPAPEGQYVEPEPTKPVEVYDMEPRILGFLPPPQEKHETNRTSRRNIGRRIIERIPPRILLHVRMFLYSVAAAILLTGVYLSTAKERTGREKLVSTGGIVLVCLAVGQVTALYLQKKKGTNGVRAENPKGYIETSEFPFEDSYPAEGAPYPGGKEQERASARSTHPINANWTEIPAEYKTQRLYSAEPGKNKGCLRSRVPERTPDIRPDHFPYIIGKLEGATDHRPKSALISRLHARLEQRTDGVYIIDLNSTNGTFVNGNRLLPSQEAKLAAGDEVALADLHFLYETGVI